MLARRAKWYLLTAGLIATVLCGVVGSLSILKNLRVTNSSDNFPIRTLSIQLSAPLDESQYDQLSAQLRNFSEKHGLQIRFFFFEGKDVLVADLYGENFRLQVHSMAPQQVNIDLYKEEAMDPPSPKSVDELFSELKSLLTEISTVTIIEEK